MGYRETNGDHGEICVAYDGNFVGFIVNLGRADRWAAFTHKLEPIRGDYGSRGPAALACWRKSLARASHRSNSRWRAAVGGAGCLIRYPANKESTMDELKVAAATLATVRLRPETRAEEAVEIYLEILRALGRRDADIDKAVRGHS